MRSLHIICVGKLKDSQIEAIEHSYIKRLKDLSLEIHEVRANAEDQDFEAKQVLKKVDSFKVKPKLVLMTEGGKIFDSTKFSRWLFNDAYGQSPSLAFVICGALGPSSELKQRADFTLSLSPLTFPHRLARLILVEQIYRAKTIFDGHPYHH